MTLPMLFRTAAIWLQSHSYELGVLDWAKKVKEEIRLGLRNLLGEKKVQAATGTGGRESHHAGRRF